MHQKSTIINAEELFEDFPNLREFQNMEDGFGKYWDWPGEIGNGFMYMIKFRPGLMLSIGDYQLRENLTVNFEFTHFPSIVLGFGVSGNFWYALGHEHDKKDVCILNSGQSIISYLPEGMGIVKYPARTRVRVVSIDVDAILLNRIMGDQHDKPPVGIRDILEGASHKHYYHSNNTTPAMNIAIHQILNCPYRGLLKRLYFESKTLELITHKLAQVVSPECGLRNVSPLRPADIERIHEAKDIVIRNMKQPPSLMELARQVGLNDFKLKMGFRQVFGKTVFGYLHEHRMEWSRLLLEGGKMNVKEVSYAVGYMDPSHFSHAFKKQFGLRPSVCHAGK